MVRSTLPKKTKEKERRLVNNSKQYVESYVLLSKGQKQYEVLKKFASLAEEFSSANVKESRLIAKTFKSKERECFMNCAVVAKIVPHLEYYEGWACPFIPVRHAWLVNKEGEVIDPTYCLVNKELNFDYFGMRIPKDKIKLSSIEPTWLPIVESQLKRKRLYE